MISVMECSSRQEVLESRKHMGRAVLRSPGRSSTLTGGNTVYGSHEGGLMVEE